MNSAHSHPLPADPAPIAERSTTKPLSSISPTLPILPPQAKVSPETASSRQHRLLHNRNARFPAKRLSLSNLSARFTQLIHMNEEPQATGAISTHQGDTIGKSKENIPLAKGHFSASSLGVLDEISSTHRRRSRKAGDIPVYQDTPERPLLERSPYSSPAPYQELSSEGLSPLEFVHVRNGLGEMRLREISGNEHRSSPFASSPFNGSIKGPKKRKSVQIKADFDTQEYIDHIERELQEAKNEMFSPTTHRSLKDQLKTARLEKDRMRQEMADLRDAFEAEMKRTLEHKTTLEVEWRRKVRDLEEDLDQKMSVIRDLELQHDEKRLDNSTTDTLKAAIERLEQEKLSLETENRSVSKRNEVLSELLAMSPTKNQQFELRSPAREKRPGRPMSLIIPRPMMSPNTLQASQPASAIMSPALSGGGPFFAGLNSSFEASKLFDQVEALCERDVTGPSTLENGTNQPGSNQPSVADPRSRRSTLQSQSSSNPSVWSQTRDSSPHDDLAQRCLPKRKPRRFVAGSTQLKPLLLPALTGDVLSQPSSAVVPTPLSSDLRDFSQDSLDSTSHLLSRPEDLVPVEDFSDLELDSSHEGSQLSSKHTVVAYQTFEEILAEHGSTSASKVSGGPLDEVEPQDHQASRVCTQTGENLQCAQPAGSAHESSHHESEQRSTSTPCFDLDALNRLGLPEAQYESYPARQDLDVPRPLFTPCSTQVGPLGLACPASSAGDEPKPRGLDSWSRPQLDSCRPGQSNKHGHVRPTSLTAMPHFSITDTRNRPTTFHVSSRNSSSDRSELPQRSTLERSDSLARTRSPLEILRQSQFGARPLASLTIRTLYGTISQCAKYVYEFKRDPLALARRILANVWFSNWARFGRMSWWVLGLFITPSIGGPKIRKWDWDQYDGETIAQNACYRNNDPQDLESATGRTALLDSPHGRHKEADLVNHGDQKGSKKPGWGRSLFLWGKFSVAIMLAVGGAVVKGPGEMLKEMDKDSRATPEELPSRRSRPRRRPHLRRGYRSFDTPSTGSPMYGHRRAGPQYFEDGHLNASPAGATTPSARNSTPPRSRYSESDAFFDGFQQMQRDGRIDEEDTLKPVRSPRMHVATIFSHGHSMHNEGFGPPVGLSAQDSHRRARGGDTSSIGDGTVQWPPSPGPIRPEDSSSVRRKRHHDYG